MEFPAVKIGFGGLPYMQRVLLVVGVVLLRGAFGMLDTRERGGGAAGGSFFLETGGGGGSGSGGTNHPRPLHLTSPPPRFVSRANTFRVVTGDTVILPCQVQDLGPLVIVWKKGLTLLSAGQQRITMDPRISLLGYNLQIENINHSDQGDYTCQIGDGSHGDLIHTVEILMAPSLQIMPSSEEITARKNGQISLECKANGNPTPVVQWSKRDGLLPSGLQVQTGYLLMLTNIQRQDAGVYQCTASNGIGQAVTGEVKLHVLYPPEIHALKSWINSGEGLEAKLSCVVYADPPAEVMWYQDSFLLQPTDRRMMSNKDRTYTLTIKNVQASDFGNYSCSVKNSIGKEKKYMELSGKPGPAKIMSPAYSNPHEYLLKWTVQSVFPILEVRLMYRRIAMNASYHSPGRWHDLLIRPQQSFDSSTGERTLSYRITNLIAESTYECLIQTKNQHGFSELSDIHQWFTSQKGRPIVHQNSAGTTTMSMMGRKNILFGQNVFLMLLMVMVMSRSAPWILNFS